MNDKIRRRVLGEWQGAFVPKKSDRRFQSIDQVIPGLMKKLNVSDRFNEEQMLKAWGETVEPLLARNSIPVRMVRKVLQVRVVQPSIHYTLQNRKPAILAALKKRFGDHAIEDIAIVLK